MVVINQEELRRAFNGKGGTVPSGARSDDLLAFDNPTTHVGGYMTAEADPTVFERGKQSTKLSEPDKGNGQSV